MHGFTRPSGLLVALWKAQDGKCFHCGEPMHFIRGDNLPKGRMATREHIMARGTRGRGIINNIVLAHGSCNHKRGCPEFPTDEEIAKTKAIYAKLGLKPFIPRTDHYAACEQWSLISKISVQYDNRYRALPRVPTMADVWPTK